GVAEELELDLGEFLDVVERGGPAGVGVALPGADAGAGGVDEDAVELGLGGEHGAAVPDDGAVVENLGAGGAFAQVGEAAGVAVAGPDEAAVVHEIGEVEGFAALTGAGVPPGFAGLGRAGVADELRAEVLDFEEALFELRHDVQVARAGVALGGGVGWNWSEAGEVGG